MHDSKNNNSHHSCKQFGDLCCCLWQEARSELEPESRLTSKLTGFKNRILKPSAKRQPGLEEPYRSSSGAATSSVSGSGPHPLDSAYDFGALAADGRDAQAQASTASQHSSGGSLVFSLHRCLGIAAVHVCLPQNIASHGGDSCPVHLALLDTCCNSAES